MKHLGQITFILAVFALLFSISCGSDDGASIDLSEVEFSFPLIDQSIIDNLNSLDDPHALEISYGLGLANSMTYWLPLFDQPAGAEQSNVPIGTCGGNVLVYTYTASSEEETFSVAYQICETSDKHMFQIFTSENGGPFQEYIYAEQSRSDNQGYMEVYDSEQPGMPYLILTWNENTDGSFDYIFTDSESPENEYKLTIKINSDNSGSLAAEDGDILYYEATWNATGTAGTYIYYDIDGNQTDSGSWPA